MKLIAPGIAAVAAVLVLASLSSSTAPGGGKLDESMQTLQGNMKRAERAFEAKDTAKLLPAILEMQKAAYEAKTEAIPKMADEKDAKAKEELGQGFRLQMIELEKNLLDVEAALVQGKLDDAAKAFDKVKGSKKAGHDKYKD